MAVRARLLHDAFERLRASDGFSHARSMAFLTALILVQAVIALVGLASALGSGRVSGAFVGMPSPRRTTAADGTSTDRSGSEAQVRPSPVGAAS